MRNSLTLSLALAAMAAAPAMAQEALPPAASPPVTDAVPLPGEAPTPPIDGVTAPADPLAPPETAPVPTPPVTAPVPETAPPAPITEPVPAPVTTPSPVTTPAPAPTSLTLAEKVEYDAWPVETQTYFDSLSPSRQALFLRIADADKVKLAALDPAQQEEVWASLENQDAEQKSDAPDNN